MFFLFLSVRTPILDSFRPKWVDCTTHRIVYSPPPKKTHLNYHQFKTSSPKRIQKTVRPNKNSLSSSQVPNLSGHFRSSRHSRASALDLVHRGPWRPQGTPLAARDSSSVSTVNGQGLAQMHQVTGQMHQGPRFFVIFWAYLWLDWWFNDVQWCLKCLIIYFVVFGIWFPFGAIGNMCKLLRTCDIFLNLKDRRKNNFILGWRCSK